MLTYKEFNKWCNERACDGCWGFYEAFTCINIGEEMNKTIFFKKKKKWKEELEPIAKEIMTKTNETIKEVIGL